MRKYAVRKFEGDTLTHHLLFYRGIQTPDAVSAFLNPDYERHTHDPFLLKGMEKAVKRILEAVAKKEKIVIYSDYDTDGIPGGVVLHDVFKKIGGVNFVNYIPHRHNEGFGLHMRAVEQFAKDGVTLLITIDCGTGDLEAIARAQKLGIDVIVTDHHLPSPHGLPDAFAIINPKQKDCSYPEKMLCGSGVIFKLVQAFLSSLKSQSILDIAHLPVGWEKWLLDMVGIATLSDMVPLIGENRVFAYYGLTVLRKTPRVGLNRLFLTQKIAKRTMTEDDIGFTIGPRINAASRMGVPMDAFKLLATTDNTEAEQLALHLEEINHERKGTVAALAKEIKKIVTERYVGELPLVLVLGNPTWRPALLGLVASSCVVEYRRPVFLWGRDGDGVIKGSCRSIEGVSVVDLMSATKEKTFTQFGGHSMSGGFSVDNDAVHFLEDALAQAYKKLFSNRESMTEELFVDHELTLDEVTRDLYRTLERLAPFGIGNSKPTFLFSDVVPAKVGHFGKEKNHLELLFRRADGSSLKAIAFFKTNTDFGRSVRAGEKLSLVGQVELSYFRNMPELRLRIVDIV